MGVAPLIIIIAKDIEFQVAEVVHRRNFAVPERVREAADFVKERNPICSRQRVDLLGDGAAFFWRWSSVVHVLDTVRVLVDHDIARTEEFIHPPGHTAVGPNAFVAPLGLRLCRLGGMQMGVQSMHRN